MIAEDIVMQKNLMSDLIPKNPNLVRIKKDRINKPKKVKEIVLGKLPEKPQALSYEGDPDPFKDAPSFIKYYRAFLQITKSNVAFDNFGVDAQYAAKILDILAENGRSGNKIFLNAWLRYFCDYKLKGDKCMKSKYTSMKVFGETFSDFNLKFSIPNNLV